MVRAQAGDWEGVRKKCSALLGRFGPEAGVTARAQLAPALTLVSGAVADPDG